MNVLAKSDVNTLARYCADFVRWKKVSKVLEKKGETVDCYDKSGNVRYVQQRPEVSIERMLSKHLLDLETQFGLTPSARSRIHIEPTKEDIDPLEEVLNRNIG